MSVAGRCPILVERDDELAALERLARDVESGAGARVVVLTGEAGAGKSRLAQQVTSSLADPWSVRSVRATRSGTSLPPVPDARPVALVIDDAHFLDPGAVDALTGRLDELGREAVLVVLAFRLGVHRAGTAEMRALAALVRDPRCLELRLAALSPAGVEQVAAAMGRYADAQLYRRTGGNPFWVEEALRSGDRVPWTVVETVTAQLDALPAVARDLATALAVAEEPVPAGAAAGLVADLDGVWPVLEEAGIGRREAGGLALRHALVAEAVQARLGPSERAAWHGRLAAALEPEPVARDRVARHWDAAGDAVRAAAVAAAAAPALRGQGATRRAFECFRLAVRHPPPDPLEAAALHEEAALTAARIGEHDTMREWLDVAEARYREAGQPDRAVRMTLDPTFDYLPIRRSRRIRDEPVERLLIDALQALPGDPAAARELIEAAVAAARSRRDGMALVRSARMVMFALGEYERGEALLDEAVALPDVTAHPGRESRVLTIRAIARYAQGYPLEALELLRQGAAVSRQEPEAVLWTGHLALADTLLLMGRIEEGAAMLIEAGRARWTDQMVMVAEGYRRFELGEVEAGLSLLESGSDGVLGAVDFDPLSRGVAASRILLALAQAQISGGRPEAAVETVRRLESLSPEPFNDCAADLAYILARAGSEIGALELVAEAERRVGDIARIARGPNVLAGAEAVRGYAAVVRGGAGADRHLQAAAGLYERASRAVLAGELWCAAARVAGPGSAATASLERARRVCESHRLPRLAALVAAVRDELHAARRRPRSALAQLTPRERDVALLAAEGLSNREIGSRLHLAEGTVRNYLSIAFEKLGVTRRAELARQVTAAQLTD